MNLETFTNETIHSCFEAVASASPNRPALVSGEIELSYGALDAAAARLAVALAAQGVSAATRVALLLPDDVPMIIGWLGTLKSGAVCVPLSSVNPVERLRVFVADADPVVLVTNDGILDLAKCVIGDGAISILNLDELPEPLQAESPKPAVTPDSQAYILYTSGTTGHPKGVIQTHRNLLRNVHVLSELMRIDPSDRLAGITAFSMGQGVATVFISLLNGATLYPYRIREAGLPLLAQWLNERRISIFTSAVTVFRQFAKSLPSEVSFPHLRVIRLGAEELRIADVEVFQRRFSRECVLLNCLGSTETMNYSAYAIDHETVITGRSVPVGHPPQGTILGVLDGDGEEISGVASGEIIVKSRYLSPGYWRDPELTLQKYHEHGGATRFYRTGDLGRRLPDGTMEYLGRMDQQVKIRGNRVEPGEIESALRSHPEIREAVVLIRRHPDAELVAHVDTHLSESKIRAFLKGRLPEYMIPSVFVRVESMPLAPSGKVDRQALPMPGRENPQAADAALTHPRNECEKGIAECWTRVLGIERIGIHDEFMSLGGDSLKSLQLFAEIRSSLNLAFDAKDVIESFTIAALAEKALSRSKKPEACLMTCEPNQDFLVPIRSGIQHPMFIIPGGWGGDNEIHLFDVIARGLKTNRPIFAVRSRALDPAWPCADTLEAHVSAILREIRQTSDGGNYFFVGECVAAVVALELAHQAEKCGAPLERVILLDPWMPPRRTWLPSFLKSLMRMIDGKPKDGAPVNGPPPRIKSYYHLVKNAKPSVVGGDIHLVLTSDGKNPPRRAVRYWKKFAKGRLHLHIVRGNHSTFIREEAAGITNLLNAILLNEAEKSRSSRAIQDEGQNRLHGSTVESQSLTPSAP